MTSTCVRTCSPFQRNKSKFTRLIPLYTYFIKIKYSNTNQYKYHVRYQSCSQYVYQCFCVSEISQSVKADLAQPATAQRSKTTQSEKSSWLLSIFCLLIQLKGNDPNGKHNGYHPSMKLFSPLFLVPGQQGLLYGSSPVGYPFGHQTHIHRNENMDQIYRYLYYSCNREPDI